MRCMVEVAKDKLLHHTTGSLELDAVDAYNNQQSSDHVGVNSTRPDSCWLQPQIWRLTVPLDNKL